MKRRILVVILLAFCITACKDSKKKAPAKSTPSTEVDQQTAAWRAKIELNNGKRWRANPETSNGVMKMGAIIKHNPRKTLEDYHTIADRLEEVKAYIIEECTMKGDAHANLHIWLAPLLTKIQSLKAAKTVQEAQQITRGIHEHLEAYFTYFL